METKQHVQLPNDMAERRLKPMDQLVYAVLKSYNGKDGCFPSQMTLAEKAHISVPSIRKSLRNLEDSGYIKSSKKGAKIYYSFSEVKTFEPFSPEFIDNDELTPTTKAYVMAAQRYMYKDVEGFGKMSYSNCQAADKMNISEHLVRKCNIELKYKGDLVEVDNKSRDPETGCVTTTKVFNMQKMGQAIIWKLQDHEDRLTCTEQQVKANTEDIAMLKEQMAEYQKRTDECEKEKEELRKEKERYEKLFAELNARNSTEYIM